MVAIISENMDEQRPLLTPVEARMYFLTQTDVDFLVNLQVKVGKIASKAIQQRKHLATRMESHCDKMGFDESYSHPSVCSAV